jgi:ABC-type branched-subunit amino acid transport system substrate-binding protein
MLITLIGVFITGSLSGACFGQVTKIGVITDLSGYGAFWGKQTRLGIELLEEDLKREGLNVSFVFGDSAFKPAQAVSEAQKLISSDNVDALFVEFSSIVNAVSPVAKNSSRLLLATCGARSFLDSNPYALKTFLDYEQGCQDIGRYWKRQGLHSIGLLRVASEIGELCFRGVKKEFPSLIEGAFNAGEDVSSQLLRMRASGVQAIFSSGFEGDTLNLLKAKQTLRWKVPIGGPDSDVLTAKVIKEYSSEIEETVTFGYPPVSESFKQRILIKDPSNDLTVIEAAANAYLFLGQVARSIAQCKKSDVECQLAKVTSNGPEELLAFKGWKDRVADHGFVLTVWTDGKRVVINDE